MGTDPDDGSWTASDDELNAATDAAGGLDAIEQTLKDHRKKHPLPSKPDILADDDDDRAASDGSAT
jgi:hypothetical protein